MKVDIVYFMYMIKLTSKSKNKKKEQCLKEKINRFRLSMKSKVMTVGEL